MDIGILITIILSGTSVYVYDADRRETALEDADETIVANVDRRGTQAELQRVELEIKFLVEASTRRDLTAEEQDRLGYLRALRIVLREQLEAMN